MEPTYQLIVTHAKNWAPFLASVAALIIVFVIIRHLVSNRLDALFSEHRIAQHLIFIFFFGFAAIIVILSLPVEETLQGQLLTLLGLLASAVIALSSTTFVGNAMAGLMLRMVKNLQPGDFLRVGEHWGRISEFGFLHTEIQTEERSLTTLPNLFLVTHPVNVMRSSGAIVSATVSLGYDVPRQRIEKALKQAAADTDLKDSYVHILDLGDFSVTYRISGFLSDVKTLISARSRLRESMLDTLHHAGIEIVSPNFMNQRQLTPGKHFIPRQKSREEESELPEPNPEKIIFDKAEQAESAEEIKQRIKELEDILKDIDEKKESNRHESTLRAITRLKEIYKNLSEEL